jgi:hypothetical protein
MEQIACLSRKTDRRFISIGRMLPRRFSGDDLPHALRPTTACSIIMLPFSYPQSR